MKKLSRLSIVLIVGMVVLAEVVLVADLFSPLGVAVEIAYLPVVLVSLLLPQKKYIFVSAVVCALFAFFGHFYSPPPTGVSTGTIDIVNRVFSIVAIAVVSFLALLVKRAEADLRRANEELESRVRQRTEELGKAFQTVQSEYAERKRLVATKSHIEQLAVVGTMSAKYAHEIRNPLSSILLNLGLMRRALKRLTQGQDEDAEAGELFRSLDSELRRIKSSTDDYLRLARLPKASPKLISLHEILDRQIEFLKSQCEKFHVTVISDFIPSPPLIYADESQMWQAILNLLNNAIEAMPTGGTLTLKTAVTGQKLALTIQDTGKGIRDEDREEIFRPFYSNKEGGTGLGLPIAHQIILDHGGTIEWESSLGKGTQFIIHLPHADLSPLCDPK